jgi:hypothetical protein
MRKSIAVLLFLVPALASAEMYRWVDEDGQVHYSEEMPKGKYEVVPDPAPPPGNEGLADVHAYVSAQDKARADAAAAAAKDQKVADADKQRCQGARQRKQMFADFEGRVRTLNPATNEYEYITDEQRAAKLRDVDQMISQFCH